MKNLKYLLSFLIVIISLPLMALEDNLEEKSSLQDEIKEPEMHWDFKRCCGSRGPTGPRGPTGATGATGAAGSTGPAFSSLVFTAQSAALTTGVTATALPIQFSSSFMAADAIPQGINGNTSVPATFTFNVPVDYVDSNATQFVIHFVTDNSNVTGDVSIGIQYAFVSNQTPPALPIFTTTVSGVTGSGTNGIYNHYEAVLGVGGIGAQANDLVIFGVVRGGFDTYNALIYLTSVEFRYSSSP